MPGFTSTLAEIAAQAAFQAVAAAAPGVAARVWNLPAGPTGVDVQDPDYLKTALDRDALGLNAAYESALTQGGSRGAAMAAKAAVDYAAAYERALHARHAAPARLRAWASARRAGHGQYAAGAGVFAAVQQQLNVWDQAPTPDDALTAIADG